MRGTHFCPILPTINRGIIPAHAGNTRHTHRRVARRGDHPRACGEHLSRSACRSCRPGSSPRMRGTLHGVPVGCTQPGIIPAHAGNTHCWNLKPTTPWDHPRACGEHRSSHHRHRPGQGSSPRMRGTREPISTPIALSGIIPAHAGNTIIRLLPIMAIRDHPRACGEHSAVLGWQRQ